MRRHCLAAGFTLVELLVVTAIISVLAAMLLPALEKANQSAKTSYCANNLRQIATGFMLYADDYGGLLPVVNAGATGSYPDYDRKYFANILADRYGLPAERWTGNIGNGRAVGGVWSCPSGHPATMEDAGSGYGVNQQHLISFPTGWGAWARGWVSLAAIKRPSGIVMIADTEQYSGGRPQLNSSGVPAYNSIIRCPVCRDWMIVSPPASVIPPRHQGKGNLAFPDGHLTTGSYGPLSLNENDVFGHLDGPIK